MSAYETDTMTEFIRHYAIMDCRSVTDGRAPTIHYTNLRLQYCEEIAREGSHGLMPILKSCKDFVVGDEFAQSRLYYVGLQNGTGIDGFVLDTTFQISRRNPQLRVLHSELAIPAYSMNIKLSDRIKETRRGGLVTHIASIIESNFDGEVLKALNAEARLPKPSDPAATKDAFLDYLVKEMTDKKFIPTEFTGQLGTNFPHQSTRKIRISGSYTAKALEKLVPG